MSKTDPKRNETHTYRDSGVDIDAGNALVEAIKPLVKSTRRPGADADLGGFGGLFDLKAAGFRDPILVAIGGTVPTNTITGYRLEDTNLDGIVKYTGASNDRDPILVNIGGVVPTNTRTEQLP